MIEMDDEKFNQLEKMLSTLFNSEGDANYIFSEFKNILSNHEDRIFIVNNFYLMKKTITLKNILKLTDCLKLWFDNMSDDCRHKKDGYIASWFLECFCKGSENKVIIGTFDYILNNSRAENFINKEINALTLLDWALYYKNEHIVKSILLNGGVLFNYNVKHYELFKKVALENKIGKGSISIYLDKFVSLLLLILVFFEFFLPSGSFLLIIFMIPILSYLGSDYNERCVGYFFAMNYLDPLLYNNILYSYFYYFFGLIIVALWVCVLDHVAMSRSLFIIYFDACIYYLFSSLAYYPFFGCLSLLHLISSILSSEVDRKDIASFLIKSENSFYYNLLIKVFIMDLAVILYVAYNYLQFFFQPCLFVYKKFVGSEEISDCKMVKNNDGENNSFSYNRHPSCVQNIAL